LRTSFWFIPGLLVTLAIILGYAAMAADGIWEDEIVSAFPFLREVSPDGVRSLLSTAATSVLALAGITFSSTLVALTLASSQFGGRLLRNFIRSLPNQVALGVLLGNFIYCLIVLRGVRSLEENAFVPHSAALLGFVGTIASLVTFIFFIHHIATSLQADNIVAAVYGELEEAIDRHFPDQLPSDADERKAGEDKEDWAETDDESVITAPVSGCIQAISIESLVEYCSARDLRCRLLHRPGHFVNAGTSLLALSGKGSEKLDDECRDGLLDAFIIGPVRTAEQDFEYCIRQLVEVSLRALSPGINDPFTAMNCIDFLGAALAQVAQRQLPQRDFSDEKGVSRVRSRPMAFGDLLDVAFHQIRQTAKGQTDVSLRLLGALGGIGATVKLPEHAVQVLRHAGMIADAGREAAQAESDADVVANALERVRERLNVSPE